VSYTKRQFVEEAFAEIGLASYVFDLTPQQITAFAVGANGAAAVYGDPTTLGADDFFRLRFYQPTNSWYRIG
jgi:hypothetical protein